MHGTNIKKKYYEYNFVMSRKLNRLFTCYGPKHLSRSSDYVLHDRSYIPFHALPYLDIGVIVTES